MIKRDAREKIIELFHAYPVVMITGPRQSGKTTLCREIFSSLPYVLFEDADVQAFAIDDPRGFLARFPDGAVFDEVQKAPQIINYLQGLVDERKKNGQFVITGSQNLLLSKNISQSLAGRVAIIQLLPFSFSELPVDERCVSWEECAVRGFFPRLYDNHVNATELMSFYFRTYVDRDVRDLIKVKDIITFQNFVRLCAGRAGQILNTSSLANDAGVSHQTAREWLSILEVSFLVFRLPPFYKNFNKRLIKAPRLYFYDTGMLSYLLEIETPGHLRTHPLRGQIFENMVVADLVKTRFNQAREHGMYYFRDSNGNEVDVIHPTANGYKIAEIKSSMTVNRDYFKGLDYFSRLVPDANVSSYLIYGGEEMQQRSNCTIIPYSNSSEFWSM